jgi:thymidylate synthase ThyX
LFRDFFRKIQFFDAMPREFEMAEITFQAVVSASNFAQLKRHRMATLLWGGYLPELGNTLPASIREAGLEDEFLGIIEAANRSYRRIREGHGAAADYILTNSHRRLVLMKMNLREMYHFIRLRDDEHAQWDIRELARSLAERVRASMPLSAMMLCGKSRFAEEYGKRYAGDAAGGPLQEI